MSAPALDRSPEEGREARGAARGTRLFDLYAVLAASVVLLARAAWLWDPYLVLDDAFISYRYAVHLAYGKGLVWNVGERVEGYTNFLWTALLAAGARWLDLPALSRVLALAAGVGTIWLLVRLARAHFVCRPLLVALPALLYAAMGSQARLAVSGMETLLFVFLLLAAVALLFAPASGGGRPLAAGLTFALAVMTRPEGAMYALLTAAFALVLGLAPGQPLAERRWRAVRIASGFAGLYVPYFVARALYYRALLPNTYYVKAAGFSWGRLARGQGLLREEIGLWSLAPILVLALVALPALRRSRLLLLGAVYAAATAAAFVWVGGDFLPFFGPRFLLPALPLLLLLAAEGVGRLASLGGSQLALRRLVTASLAALLLWNAAWLSWPGRFWRFPALALEMRSWTELGRWIAANTPPGTVLATGGAGIVPFYARRPAIDYFGLCDAHIARLPPRPGAWNQPGHEKYDPAYVLARRPDLIEIGISREGVPITAGFAAYAGRIATCYRLAVLVKNHDGPAADGSFLLETDKWRPERFDEGYQIVVYARRLGLRAQRLCGP